MSGYRWTHLEVSRIRTRKFIKKFPLFIDLKCGQLECSRSFCLPEEEQQLTAHMLLMVTKSNWDWLVASLANRFWLLFVTMSSLFHNFFLLIIVNHIELDFGELRHLAFKDWVDVCRQVGPSSPKENNNNI